MRNPETTKTEKRASTLLSKPFVKTALLTNTKQVCADNARDLLLNGGYTLRFENGAGTAKDLADALKALTWCVGMGRVRVGSGELVVMFGKWGISTTAKTPTHPSKQQGGITFELVKFCVMRRCGDDWRISSLDGG